MFLINFGGMYMEKQKQWQFLIKAFIEYANIKIVEFQQA